MARLISYRANRAGESRVARSAGMRSMLEHRGESVRLTAQSGYNANPPQEGQFDVDVLSDSTSRVGFEVARVAVLARHPAALAYEAKHRILGSALSSARGL